MLTRSSTALSLLLVGLVGCTPTARPAPSAPGETQPTAQTTGPKVLTIAAQTPRPGFGPWFVIGSPLPLQWEELASNFLVTGDGAGNLEPALVQQLPSLRDGTIQLLPDGQMRTTWKLRPGVKWQDGQPFTVEDVQFTLQVIRHPEIPVQLQSNVRLIESIDAIDPSTMVISYGRTQFDALGMGYRDLYLLPKHLLGEAFAGPKEAFMSLPYFSTEYVHTGPFRLRESSPGEQMVFERFDGYYLGRPKLDRVIMRFIADTNVVVSNLLSGAADLAGELPMDIALRLRDDWQQSGGGGTLLTRQAFWRFIAIQFNPEWGGPPELQRDVRTRAGLAYAMDVDALRDAFMHGLPDTAGDTFMLKDDPKIRVVGRPFARYKYDQAQALRSFGEAGWRRAADGRMLNGSGEQVSVQLRVAEADIERDLPVVARYWREVGLDVGEEIVPATLRRDAEYNAKYPGLLITAQGPSFWNRFDSRQTPTAENRYTGSNRGYYANPAFNTLIDRLVNTIDQDEAALAMKAMGDIMADDLPALPYYFGIRTVVVLARVRGVDDIYGAPGQVGTTASKAYQWDVV